MRPRALTHVYGKGWYGRDFEVELEGPTMFVGPNGSGKSMRLNAVKYALTGEHPSGKSAAGTAAHVGPEGGKVELIDASGAQLVRGVTIAKGKTTEIFDVSRGEDGVQDYARWGQSHLALDVAKFRELSPALRREAVVELLTSDEVEADPMATLDLAVARKLGGSGSTAALFGPRDEPLEGACECGSDDDPVLLEDAVVAYLALRPGFEAVAGEGWEPVTFAAKERKLSAARGKKEAKAAANRLSDAARGAPAAASELRARQADASKAQAALRDAELRYAGASEAARRIPAATRQANTGREDREHAERALAAVQLEEVPPSTQGEMDMALANVKEADQALSAILMSGARRVALEERITQARAALELEATTSEIELLEAVEQIPDDAHPLMPRVRLLAESVCDTQRTKVEARKEALARLEADLAAAPPVTDEAVKAAHVHLDTEQAVLAAMKKHAADCAAAVARQAECQREIDRASKYEAAGVKALAEAQAAMARYGGSVEALADEVARAQDTAVTAGEALAEAQKAAGAIAAYETELARAISETARWRVAGAVEECAKALRDTAAGGVAKALEDELRGVLKSFGHAEVPWVDNTKGLSLGWVNLDGVSVALESLSGGQAALLVLALSLCHLRRQDGRRVLLLEADALDFSNLGHVCGGLRKYADQLDCVMVATNKNLRECEGWKVVRC